MVASLQHFYFIVDFQSLLYAFFAERDVFLLDCNQISRTVQISGAENLAARAFANLYPEKVIFLDC